MLVLGLDFTSAPSASKPITCERCTLEGTTLTVNKLDRCPDFASFERVLAHPGPYIAAIDFPFSQPNLLMSFHGWPAAWPEFVAHVGSMHKLDFEKSIEQFRNAQPAGRKHPLRRVDREADSCSPLMLSGVPVGKMFYQGAPRILRSGACVIPCHPKQSQRIIVEAYPGVAVRSLLGGKLSYKSDERSKQTPERQQARRAIIARLGHPDGVGKYYGLSLDVSVGYMSAMLLDASGDTLDAVLCALQGAWSYAQRESGFGIPHDADPNEGWIPDPGLLRTFEKVERVGATPTPRAASAAPVASHRFASPAGPVGGISHDPQLVASPAKTPPDLHSRAIQILIRELGYADAMAFMLQLSKGSGDYTAERHAMLPPRTVDQLVHECDRVIRDQASDSKAP